MGIGPQELRASTLLFLRAKPGVRSQPFTAVTGLWSGDGWAASRPIWPGAELSLTVRAKLPSQLRVPSSHVPVNPPIPGGAPNCCSPEAAPSLLRWAYCPKGTPTHTTCPWGAPSRVGVLCRMEWPPGSRLRGGVQIPLGLVCVHVCVCLGDVCDCGWDVCSWAPAACAGARLSARCRVGRMFSVTYLPASSARAEQQKRVMTGMGG